MELEKQIKGYTLAFYDKQGCYDEYRFGPYKLSELEYALFYISLPKEELGGDYGRLFVRFEDGSSGEISFKMSE